MISPFVSFSPVHQRKIDVHTKVAPSVMDVRSLLAAPDGNEHDRRLLLNAFMTAN